MPHVKKTEKGGCFIFLSNGLLKQAEGRFEFAGLNRYTQLSSSLAADFHAFT
jgi:hypothetical protein